MPSPLVPFRPQLAARIAGGLYLVVILLGLWSEMAVRAPLMVSGAPDLTAANILADETLFRLGLIADAAMIACDVVLAAVLYALLRPVCPVMALSAMAFRLVQAAILGANLLNLQAAVLVLRAGGPNAVKSATLALDLHRHGYDLGLIFFGLNSLLTGVLLIRSGLLPAAIGALIVVAGAVYLTGSHLLFLLPAAADSFAPTYAVSLLAETALCLWLLLRGVDATAWARLLPETNAGKFAPWQERELG